MVFATFVPARRTKLGIGLFLSDDAAAISTFDNSAKRSTTVRLVALTFDFLLHQHSIRCITDGLIVTSDIVPLSLAIEIYQQIGEEIGHHFRRVRPFR